MCGFVAIVQEAPVIDRDAARRALDSIAHPVPMPLANGSKRIPFWAIVDCRL